MDRDLDWKLKLTSFSFFLFIADLFILGDFVNEINISC